MNPVSFPHTDVSLKVLLALGVGLLVGLEREFASKDVGVRTFSLAALLGLCCQMLDINFAVVGFVGVLCLITYMNVRAMLVNRSLEITTSVALLITYCLGTLVGLGHVFTPVAISILMTMLLAWKMELSAFAHGLHLEEIRSAVILGLLTFVIYPILPNQFIDPWDLFNPREAWMTVIVLAGISFANYILLKMYSMRGLYYSALLGGAVNSSAAVTEISRAVKLPSGVILPHAFAILLMTTIAMFSRNLILLGVFEPSAIPLAIAPLAGMILTASYFVWRAYTQHEEGLTSVAPMKLDSPVAMRRVLKFGVLFVVLQAAGTLGQRYLGAAGVMTISFLGGLVSSASTAAAAAKLASQGKITPDVAAISVVLTSISSAFVNLPLVNQVTHDKALTKRLGIMTTVCVLSGLVLMALAAWFRNIVLS